MPTCKDYTEIISQSLDRKLPWWQRCQLRIHLLICIHCARFSRQVHFLVYVVAEYLASGQEPSSISALVLSPQARARIKRSLQDEES